MIKGHVAFGVPTFLIFILDITLMNITLIGCDVTLFRVLSHVNLIFVN
jgi:hypothetical protein